MFHVKHRGKVINISSSLPRLEFIFSFDYLCESKNIYNRASPKIDK